MDNKVTLINNINDIKIKINNIWNSIYIKDIDTIKENWQDPICEEYIEQLKKVDSSIHKIIDNLDDLKKKLNNN